MASRPEVNENGKIYRLYGFSQESLYITMLPRTPAVFTYGD